MRLRGGGRLLLAVLGLLLVLLFLVLLVLVLLLLFLLLVDDSASLQIADQAGGPSRGDQLRKVLAREPVRDWQTALEYAARTIADVRENKGAAAIGALASPNSTLEELHLLAKLMRGIGSENVDFRLRQSDFSAEAAMAGVPK